MLGAFRYLSQNPRLQQGGMQRSNGILTVCFRWEAEDDAFETGLWFWTLSRHLGFPESWEQTTKIGLGTEKRAVGGLMPGLSIRDLGEGHKR